MFLQKTIVLLCSCHFFFAREDLYYVVAVCRLASYSNNFVTVKIEFPLQQTSMSFPYFCP